MSNHSNQSVYPALAQYVVARGKVPIDPETRDPIDPHDPANQMSRDQAERIASDSGLNIGFVLSENDPYWCLDLDKCRNPVTGEWSDKATEIAAKFRGNLMEISISGTGLHIWGAFESREGWEAYRNRDEARGIEFYYRKRFIVINPATAAGQCDAKSDDALRSVIRRREVAAPHLEIDLSDKPEACPEPLSEEDRTLVERALKRTPSPLAARGQAPTICQLWDARADLLAEFFPASDDRPYDASAADAALARELVLLCDGDVNRALRLMWHSALRREKWNRSDYLHRTMEDAARRAAPALARRAPRTADQAFAGVPVPQLPINARPPGLKLIQASTLTGPPPPLSYVVQGWIPAGFVTLLYGDGGTGKSYLMTILAVVLAAKQYRQAWLDLPVTHGPVIIFSAEDSLDVLHRRIHPICDALGICVTELGDLHIAPMSSEDSTLYSGEDGATPLFGLLADRMAEIKPRLVVIDTASDVFDGDENKKSDVRRFLRTLGGIVEGTETGIVVLAHPSKSGMDSGRNDAGSVAWNATARARITYRIDRDNPEIRHLELTKNNHGPDKLKISVGWRDGSFRKIGLTDRQTNTTAQQIFLKLLELFTEQGRTVNSNSGPNYAPKVFSEHPEAAGVTKIALRTAMNQLFLAGIIRNEKTKNSTRIVRTAEKSHTLGGANSPETPKSEKNLPQNSPLNSSQTPPKLGRTSLPHTP